MKKNIAKVVSMVSICAILGSSISAFAVSTEKESDSLPSKVVVVREDIPLSVAMTDANFSVQAALEEEVMQPESNNVMQPNSTSWQVWGAKGLNSTSHLHYPIGYSRHQSGGTILETYHYTRTFLGSSVDPRGDSGRVWGNYTVTANGTDCLQDVWDVFTHKVYYGKRID